MIPEGLRHFQIAGRTYRIHSFTGALLDHKKRSVTEVHGSGGGGSGYSYQGTGMSSQAPIRITSTTTTHDDMILQAADGQEEAFQLLDFDLAARDGHTLTVLWAIRHGKTSGSYFAVYNHDTRTDYFQHAVLRKLGGPGLLRGVGITIASFIMFIPLAGPGAFLLAPPAAWGAYALMRHLNVKRFKADVCGPLFQHLGSIAPLEQRSQQNLRSAGG
jgi:hypothetical protein